MGQLISCLCVSRPSRWGLLQRAILDFKRQTYADRELVVAVNSPQYAEQVRGFAAAAEIPAPVTVVRRDQRDQAALLLHAQAAALGSLLAVWDDDNLNIPDRLTFAADAAEVFPDTAVMLGEALYHFYDTGEVFAVRFEHPGAPLSRRAAVTSLVLPRRLAPAWTFAGKSNSSIAAAADAMTAQRVPTMVIAGKLPYGHLIGVRGDNLRGEVYHRNLATSLPLTKTAEWLRERKADVTEWLNQYVWDNRTLAASGPDGVAFECQPKFVWPANLFPIGGPDDGVVRTTEQLV